MGCSGNTTTSWQLSGLSSVQYIDSDGDIIPFNRVISKTGRYKVIGLSVLTSMTVRLGLGTSNNATANFTLSRPQVEQGSTATFYIPTTTSAVTRNADVISKSGLSGITTITETFEDEIQVNNPKHNFA